MLCRADRSPGEHRYDGRRRAMTTQEAVASRPNVPVLRRRRDPLNQRTADSTGTISLTSSRATSGRRTALKRSVRLFRRLAERPIYVPSAPRHRQHAFSAGYRSADRQPLRLFMQFTSDHGRGNWPNSVRVVQAQAVTARRKNGQLNDRWFWVRNSGPQFRSRGYSRGDVGAADFSTAREGNPHDLHLRCISDRHCTFRPTLVHRCAA